MSVEEQSRYHKEPGEGSERNVGVGRYLEGIGTKRLVISHTSILLLLGYPDDDLLQEWSKGAILKIRFDLILPGSRLLSPSDDVDFVRHFLCDEAICRHDKVEYIGGQGGSSVAT